MADDEVALVVDNGSGNVLYCPTVLSEPNKRLISINQSRIWS